MKFRSTSPGWPETPLSLYAAAFDERALGVYRRGIQAYATAAGTHEFDRRKLLVELAAHDGDLDRAVQLLSEGERVAHGDIVTRLREAGRIREAIASTERALAERGVSERETKDFWVGADDVLAWYREDGREGVALTLARGWYRRAPSPSWHARLMRAAAQLGAETEQADQAAARERAEATPSADV